MGASYSAGVNYIHQFEKTSFMQSYWDVFMQGYQGYANYFWNEVTHPSFHNYFYWLILVSVFFMLLEWYTPWRKKQSRFRKDFWLDAFYMFFNFFLFSLIIYNAASDVVVNFFNDAFLSISGYDLQGNNPMRLWPMWAILITGFVIRDFIQWWVHRLLHRSDRLWEYHKVHHSVEEMGFAAHLRYHWMETIVYRAIEYIPLALLGIGLYDFFIIHIFALMVGHYNHSNITVSGYVTGAVLGGLVGIPVATGAFDISIFSYPGVGQQVLIILAGSFAGSIFLGPFMKFIFNSPEMHIWHHAYEMPQNRKYGINFGLTLSLWDWLFGTGLIPYEGKDIKLGFPGIEKFPGDFIHQVTYGFKRNIDQEPRIINK
jgi:sterol desaturase/sphingolipid hydroxylase (fatty acid hydroxylase superfamily)